MFHEQEIAMNSSKRPRLSFPFQVLVALTGLLVGPALSHAEGPPRPADMKKTVEAFAGNWLLDATITMPGAPPQKTKLAFDCKKTALGKAVICNADGNFPGTGPSQAAFLVGYDTLGKAVHFMGVTSDDEVHDHKCQWKTPASLECEPLKGGSGGEPVTEELSFVSGKGMLTLKSTTITKDGQRMGFEAVGKR
jgi:hypothetical protein